MAQAMIYNKKWINTKLWNKVGKKASSSDSVPKCEFLYLSTPDQRCKIMQGVLVKSGTQSYWLGMKFLESLPKYQFSPLTSQVIHSTEEVSLPIDVARGIQQELDKGSSTILIENATLMGDRNYLTTGIFYTGPEVNLRSKRTNTRKCSNIGKTPKRAKTQDTDVFATPNQGYNAPCTLSNTQLQSIDITPETQQDILKEALEGTTIL